MINSIIGWLDTCAWVSVRIILISLAAILLVYAIEFAFKSFSLIIEYILNRRKFKKYKEEMMLKDKSIKDERR